jgi:hypothetical protein
MKALPLSDSFVMRIGKMLLISESIREPMDWKKYRAACNAADATCERRDDIAVI